MTRFDNSISVVDPVGTNDRDAADHLQLHNPEPRERGRRPPLPLRREICTSSNGEASCSSCHIFGDMDDLAWDLGNPDDDRAVNSSNPMNDEAFTSTNFTSCELQNLFVGKGCVFHPIKGPMTTQSLRGMAQ